MAVSLTATWTLNADGIVDAANARLGGESTPGYQAASARRALHLLLMSWTNRGISFSAIDQESLALTAGTASYTLPADTVDVLDMVIRTTSGAATTDLLIRRVGRSEWFALPDKDSQGEPTQAFVDLQRDAPVLTLWPVPDATTAYTLVYYRIRRFRDIPSLGSDLDVHVRFMPALVSGLAYYMARERPDIPEQKLARLKAEYEEEYAQAAETDRDRGDLRVVPDLSCYWGRR